MSCSEANLRYAMGHKDGSWTCWKHYKSQKAAVDFQNILRGREGTDVVFMSSMSLGRVEGAPLALSRAGAEKIERDPEFRLAVAKANDALDEVTRKCDTPSEARNRQSVEYDRLEVARRAMNPLYERLTRREIAQEYKRATVNTAAPRDQEPAGPGLTANLDNQVGLQSSVHDSSSSAVDLPESNEHHLETSNNDTSNLTNSFDSSDEDALLQDPRTLDRSIEAQILETFNSMAVDNRTDDGHGDHSEGNQGGKTAATNTADCVIEGLEDGRAPNSHSKKTTRGSMGFTDFGNIRD
jgi:hypothetical protein